MSLRSTPQCEIVDAAPESMEMAPGGQIAAAPSGGGEESAVARAPTAAGTRFRNYGAN